MFIAAFAAILASVACSACAVMGHWDGGYLVSVTLAVLSVILGIGGFAKKRSILRFLALGLLVLAGLGIFMIAFGTRVGSTGAPVETGTVFPFEGGLTSSGDALTAKHFADGNKRLVIFFRGHW